MKNNRTYGTKISDLIEVFCDEVGIEYEKSNSWMLASDCFTFTTIKSKPDLAISLDEWEDKEDLRLAMFASVKINEIWRWHNQEIEIYNLASKDKYERKVESEALPKLNVKELETFVGNLEEPPSELKRRYKTALRKRLQIRSNQ